MWWQRGSLLLLQTIAGRWRQHDASTRHGRWPAKLLAGETLLQTLLVLLVLLLECRHGGQLMRIAGRIVVVVAVVVVIVVVEVAVPC